MALFSSLLFQAFLVSESGLAAHEVPIGRTLVSESGLAAHEAQIGRTLVSKSDLSAHGVCKDYSNYADSGKKVFS